jgi:hypothetical protein
MAGFPVVEVLSGGVPATATPNGPICTFGVRGMPVTMVASGGFPLYRVASQITALNENPEDPQSWSSSDATAAPNVGTILGFSSTMRVTSTGLLGGRVQTTINGGLTAGPVYAVRALYSAGTSPNARIRIGSATQASVLAGPLGALVSTDETAGKWSNIVNINRGGGAYEVQALLSASLTISATLGIGPDTAVIGLDVIVVAAQITLGSALVPFP